MASPSKISLRTFAVLVIVCCVSGRIIDDELGIILEREELATYRYQNLTNDELVTLVEGDIEVDESRSVIGQDAQRWPNGTIPYILGRMFKDPEKQKILAAMREIENSVNTKGEKSCIQFVERQPADPHALLITPADRTCSAFVGVKLTAGLQKVNLGKFCFANGIIMHELLHAVGLWHEQDRPDRDKYVSIDKGNLMNDRKNVYDIQKDSRTLGFPYDYNSVMHYDAYSFAKNVKKPVMTPKTNQVIKGRMGQRWRLSPLDVQKTQRLYGCKEDTSHIQTRTLLDSCSFEKADFCAFKLGQHSTFNWTIKSGRSKTGPYADASTGKSYYAIAEDTHNRGKAAYLESRLISGTPLCLEFYMFNHKTEGTISVYVRKQGSHFLSPVTAYRGQSEQKWYFISATIEPPYDYLTYQVVFAANPNGRDIALDDVKIFRGRCE